MTHRNLYSYKEIEYYFPNLIPKEFLGRPERNLNDLLREFETEKWGKLLEIVESDSTLGFYELELMQYSEQEPTLFFTKDGFTFSDKYSGRIYFHNLLLRCILDQELHDVNNLVEIGSGYGSLLYAIYQADVFDNYKSIGLELSKSACQIMDTCSSRAGIDWASEIFDINNYSELPTWITSDSVVFSSFTLAYLLDSKRNIISDVLARGPKAFVVCEPIYQHFNHLDANHAIKCVDYFEKNRYSKNILTLVHDALGDYGNYEISFELQNAVGQNPWCPVSVIVISKSELI